MSPRIVVEESVLFVVVVGLWSVRIRSWPVDDLQINVIFLQLSDFLKSSIFSVMLRKYD